MPIVLNAKQLSSLAYSGKQVAYGVANGGIVYQIAPPPVSVPLVPAMTSATTPAPFVVTSSTVWANSSQNYPHLSFDGTHNNSGWIGGNGSAAGTVPGGNSDANGYLNDWIKVYLGQPRTVTGMTLTGRTNGFLYQVAREFTLDGSFDDITYFPIFTAHDGDVALATSNFQTIFDRHDAWAVKCSYIRQTVTRIWQANTNVSGGKIQYYGY